MSADACAPEKRKPSPVSASAARRTLRSFGYAFEGLSAIVRAEPNFVVHLVVAVAALALGLFLHLSLAELATVVLTIGVVLAAEAFNTALEAACDAASPDLHPLIKRAKDAAAAGVLVAALAAVVVGALLFGPRLLALL